MERQELLKSLTELSTASTGQEAVLALQAWFRHVARARTMQVQLPDGSIMLSALDNLSKGLLSQHAHVALNLSRHQLKLDYRAELETVEEYARSLLAEFEVLSLSSEPKKQKVREVKEKEGEDSAAPKPPPKAPRIEPAATDRGQGGSNKLCLQWMSDSGCKYGDKCRFIHSADESALKGRCFLCSATDHWANSCPVKAARKAEARGGSGGKAKGKGKQSKGGPALKGLADEPDMQPLPLQCRLLSPLHLLPFLGPLLGCLSRSHRRSRRLSRGMQRKIWQGKWPRSSGRSG